MRTRSREEVRDAMKPSLVITHYYHSGFSVAWNDVLLVFDYWRGEKGELSPEVELTDLRREFPDVAVKPIDCTNNQGQRPVSLAQALKWNYTVSAADLERLMSALLEAINNGDISTGALRSATGNLLSIPGLSTRGQALAGQINSRVDDILKDYVIR